MSEWWPDAQIHTDMVSIIRVTEGKPDADGIPTTVETRQLHTPCSVQPESSSEPAIGDHVVTSRWRVSGPTAPWIRARDAAEVSWLTDDQGTPIRLEVDGRPQTYWSGPLPHTEYFLIERAG